MRVWCVCVCVCVGCVGCMCEAARGFLLLLLLLPRVCGAIEFIDPQGNLGEACKPTESAAHVREMLHSNALCLLSYSLRSRASTGLSGGALVA
jgi:hypothetical protein